MASHDPNNNNTVDEGFENDNISVTGSVSLAAADATAHDDDDDDDGDEDNGEQRDSHDGDKRNATPSPLGRRGAFTAFIQRNPQRHLSDGYVSLQQQQQQLHLDQQSNLFKKVDILHTDFRGGDGAQPQTLSPPPPPPAALSAHPQPHHLAHHPHAHHQSTLSHALAAQLFLQQSPLIPPPSQWLYTQLYSNYSDMPWFRNTLPPAASASGLVSAFRPQTLGGGDQPPLLLQQHSPLLQQPATQVAQPPVEQTTAPLTVVESVEVLSQQPLLASDAVVAQPTSSSSGSLSPPPVSSSQRSPSPAPDSSALEERVKPGVFGCVNDDGRGGGGDVGCGAATVEDIADDEDEDDDDGDDGNGTDAVEVVTGRSQVASSPGRSSRSSCHSNSSRTSSSGGSSQSSGSAASRGRDNDDNDGGRSRNSAVAVDVLLGPMRSPRHPVDVWRPY